VGDGDQDVLLLPVELEEKIDNALGVHPVQITGRFVAEKERGSLYQSTSNRSALALAPRELGGQVSYPVSETDAVEKLSCPRF
jgi:hypothetical protein